MKNDISYEYRKNLKRPDLIMTHVEVGKCTYDVLMNQLKKPCKWRLYHTEDTNQFFFDYNGVRYALNLFGNGGSATPVIDLTQYAKKTDIPTKISELKNDSEYITITNLSDFLKTNKYITEEQLKNALESIKILTVPKNVSAFENDAEYITKKDLNDALSGLNKDANDIMVDPDGDGPNGESSLQEVIINMTNAINKLEELDVNYAEDSDIDNIDEVSDSDTKPIIHIKTLKYFRDKLPFKVSDNNPTVEINGHTKELSTKEYVDNLLVWKTSLD